LKLGEKIESLTCAHGHCSIATEQLLHEITKQFTSKWPLLRACSIKDDI